MNSEQLKQEAEDKGIIYADSLKVDIKVEDGVDGYAWYQVEQAYERGALDFAEPRELKIAELERENTGLREKLKPENCLRLLAKEGYIKFTSDQLDKAKKIIKDLLDTQYRLDPYRDIFKDRITAAEQFLSEVESDDKLTI